MDKKFRYILLKNKLKQKWSNFFENIEHYRFMCIVGMTVVVNVPHCSCCCMFYALTKPNDVSRTKYLA